MDLLPIKPGALEFLKSIETNLQNWFPEGKGKKQKSRRQSSGKQESDEPHDHPVGVSKNRGTPEWMVCNGKPYSNGWFGGTAFLETPMYLQDDLEHSKFPNCGQLDRYVIMFFLFTHFLKVSKPHFIPQDHDPNQLGRSSFFPSGCLPQTKDWWKSYHEFLPQLCQECENGENLASKVGQFFGECLDAWDSWQTAIKKKHLGKNYPEKRWGNSKMRGCDIVWNQILLL